MIRTTHAARRLVAALAAVLLAGMLGLGALAGFSGSERRSSGTTASVGQDSPTHPRVTIAKAGTDDHSVSVDLPAGTVDVALGLVTAALAALAVALVAAQIGTAAPVPAGRAPPRR